MPGDKPDPRLRTPMHWKRGSAAGFTIGVPWEPLQPDSMTANVEALESDPGSLLNLHRRLIHLRAANPALATGELIPLVASSEAVAAYLRRDGDRTVLVVANLGTTSQSGTILSAPASTLKAGRYVPTTILGEGTAVPLRVQRDGSIQRFVPIGSIGPMQILVFDLVPAR